MKVEFHAQSIYDIDPLFFKANATTVVTDLDNTLDPADVFTPSPRAVALVRELQALGLKVLILSNNTQKRCEDYCKTLAVPFLPSSFKYWDFRIKKFLRQQGVTVRECLFVGDQIFTDRIYVRQLKGRLILTEPLSEKDNLVTKVPRFFDRKIRAKWARKGQLGQECPRRKKED